MTKRGKSSDISNTIVAVVLVATIIFSFAGTFIVLESVSSLGKTVQIVNQANNDDTGKITFAVTGEPKIALSESISSQGKLKLEIKKPK